MAIALWRLTRSKRPSKGANMQAAHASLLSGSYRLRRRILGWVEEAACRILEIVRAD